MRERAKHKRELSMRDRGLSERERQLSMRAQDREAAQRETERAKHERKGYPKHERELRWCTSHRGDRAFAVSALTSLSALRS